MVRDRIVARQRQAAEREQVTNRVAVDINKVDQALYRPDLGFKLTNQGNEEFRANEAQFQQEYSTVTKSNREAIDANTLLMKQLQEAQGRIESINPEAIYGDLQKGFVPVRVVPGKPFYAEDEPYEPEEPTNATPARFDAEGNRIVPERPVATGQPVYNYRYSNTEKGTIPNEDYLYTVYLPKEVVDSLDSSINKKGSYLGEWRDGEYIIGDAPLGAGGRYGKELSKTLYGAETQVKSSFFTQLQPKIEEAQKMYGPYETKKQEAQKYIDLSTDTLNKTEQVRTLRENEKGAYKKQYEQSVGQRQALFR